MIFVAPVPPSRQAVIAAKSTHFHVTSDHTGDQVVWAEPPEVEVGEMATWGADQPAADSAAAAPAALRRVERSQATKKKRAKRSLGGGERLRIAIYAVVGVAAAALLVIAQRGGL